MRINSDSANKLVKQITSARSALVAQERQVTTYSFLQGEEPFKPDYDFAGTQAKLDKMNADGRRAGEDPEHEYGREGSGVHLPEL